MTDFFSNNGFDLSYLDEGAGEPVLLLHGFASSVVFNWTNPGWIKTLTDAGYRTIAFDHRGHGASTKSYKTADYHPDALASDAVALLDRLAIPRAHVFGYSMGARVAAFMALQAPDRVATLIFGGLGSGMVDGVGDWDPIADALMAEDAGSITHPRGKMFRAFADQTRSDRKALAACIAESRAELTQARMEQINQPTLVAVGTRDDIGGSPERLAAMLPHGEPFAIEGRDHMLAVGDRSFKARVLEFLTEHPIAS